MSRAADIIRAELEDKHMMTDVTEVAERARKMMADAVPAIIQDVCEVDITGKWNRDDNPDRVVITVQQLEAILRAHLVEPLER